MKHVSPAIASDLDKMHPDHAREIRRVAGSDTSSSAPRGANSREPARDMARKIGAHRDVARPPAEMPQSSGKPVADWPVNRATFSSGVAKRGSTGTMPS